MHKNPETVLALDPGLRELGYAVLSRKQLVTSGVLSLSALHPRRRLGAIRDTLEAWFRAYRPRVLVLEQIPKRPLDSLAGLPALRRLLHGFARRRRLPVATYSVKAVRRTVLGDGWGSKREVAKAISGRFPELRVHRNQSRKWAERYWQNMFDAIA